MWALVIALFSELLSAAMENSRMYEGKIRRVMKYLRYVNAPPSMVLPILQFYRRALCAAATSPVPTLVLCTV